MSFIAQPAANLHSPGPIGDVTPGTIAGTTTALGNTTIIGTGTPLLVRRTGDNAVVFTLLDSGEVDIFSMRVAQQIYTNANNEFSDVKLGLGSTAVVGWNAGQGYLTPDAAIGRAAANAVALVNTNTQKATLGGVIFADFTSTSTTHTDGTEDDLYTHTHLASQLGVNGDSIEQLEHVSFVSSVTAARRCKKYFGGTLIFDSGSLTLSLGGEFDILTTIIRESATVARVSVLVTSTSASSIPYSTYTRITGLTLSSTNILKTTGIASGTGAASADIANVLSKTWWYPAAY